MNSAVKKYLSAIGKKGGKVKSDAKTESSRNNGKLGGRPRKVTGAERAPSIVRQPHSHQGNPIKK